MLVLFGCRLFKATLFLITLIAVSGFVYFVGTGQGQDQRLMLGVGAALGVFCGLLAIQLWKVALFLVGALVGVVLFVLIKSVQPGLLVTPVAEYAALLLPALVLGVFSVCMERWWLLFATPVLGSFLTMQGVDHYADLEINVFGTLSGRDVCVTNECYGLWAAVAGFALLGMLVQWRWTAGFSHSQSGSTPRSRAERYVPSRSTLCKEPQCSSAVRTRSPARSLQRCVLYLSTPRFSHSPSSPSLFPSLLTLHPERG